jgi:hypothetical protein
MARGDFFQIRKSVLPELTELGMNALIAYLILARGSAGDNRRTTWSTNAIEKNTGIGRIPARNAIGKLAQTGFLDVVKAGKKPVYRLSDSPASTELYGFDNGLEWIWLPNSIVDGVGREVPPIEKLRRSGSVETLELFIGLYDLQNLADAHGIHWAFLRGEYKRSKVWSHSHYTVWGFDYTSLRAFRTGPLAGFLQRAGNDWDKLCTALSQLETQGLIESSAYAVEGLREEAAIIFPLDKIFHPQIYTAVRDLTNEILARSEAQSAYERHDIVAAISAEYPAAEVVEIYRMRYRAKTALSASWVASPSAYIDLASKFSEIPRRFL